MRINEDFPKPELAPSTELTLYNELDSVHRKKSKQFLKFSEIGFTLRCKLRRFYGQKFIILLIPEV